MASTFTTITGTVSFTATTDSWAEQAVAEVNVLSFPGGDAVAISISGQREIRRTFVGLFTSPTEFRRMRDMRARVGVLQIENWDTGPVNAILTSISPLPPHISGEVSANVSFIVY